MPEHTADIDAGVAAYPDPARGESYEHWRRKFNEYVSARLAKPSSGLTGVVCTDPDCTIPRRPGFPMHGPHDFRARTTRPTPPDENPRCGFIDCRGNGVDRPHAHEGLIRVIPPGGDRHECGRDFDPSCSGCVTSMSDAYGSDRSGWPL